MQAYRSVASWLLSLILSAAAVSAAAPVLQRSDAMGLLLGEAVEYHVVATGGATAFSAQGLPPGTTINAATGLISGTPTEIGTYSVTITAQNADGSASTTLRISIVDPSAAPLIYAPLTFDAYADARQGGGMFSCALKATGSPTKFETTGPLPSGWTFSGATLVGATGTPGLYMVPVSATNANGVGSAAITVRVHPACTQLQQTTGTLKPGDTFTVSLRFNRPVSVNGAPYLEFHTYPDGATRQLRYVSGSGTDTLQFVYTVTAGDAPGDILLYSNIQPATNGGVDVVTDADGLSAGAVLPFSGPYTPSASIAAASAPVAPAATVASTPSASAPDTTSTNAGTTVTPQASATQPTTAAVTSSAATAPAAPTTSSSPSTVSTTASPAASTATATATPGLEPTGATTATTPVATASTPASANGSSRLVNLSARASVSEGDSAQSFIAGFVVSGSSPKRMLLRAVGPSLSNFGVQRPLPNPELRVLDSAGKVLAENEDWNSGQTASTASAVGAFGLSSGTRDAAVAVTLPPGMYSMQVTPNGGSGIALAEVYDADGGNAAGSLLNLSSRGFVANGERVLTAGFVVSGSSPKRVLIRAVGPTLAKYGVSGVLSDPALTVYQSGTVVAQNDNWSGQDVAAAAQSVGAFALEANSRDASVVATLPPGAYSAVVSPADGASSGAAMVEVYELP
jgi:hypothetical protein